MPELNGIEAARQILERCGTTQVIILSMHATTEHIARALQAGARGYLLKESAGSEVVEAVRAVHAGRRYLSQRERGVVENSLARLSSREREVLQQVVTTVNLNSII